jgi:hypothetical protein
MGAGASDLAGMEPSGKVARTGLDDLPELCAAEVLLHLDAPDICRLARLNRAFRGAAAADFVWEAKLPENYGPLLRFVDGAEGGEMGKKDIFARLAKPVPFDGGRRVRFFPLFGRSRSVSIFQKVPPYCSRSLVWIRRWLEFESHIV